MSDKKSTIERLREIIRMARTLNWLTSQTQVPFPLRAQISYQLMQLSEVEKCMIAMVDDSELERMRKWCAEASV